MDFKLTELTVQCKLSIYILMLVFILLYIVVSFYAPPFENKYLKIYHFFIIKHYIFPTQK